MQVRPVLTAWVDVRADGAGPGHTWLIGAVIAARVGAAIIGIQRALFFNAVGVRTAGMAHAASMDAGNEGECRPRCDHMLSVPSRIVVAA